MTGQSGIRHRWTFFTPVLGAFLMLALLLAGGCRQPSLEDTVRHLDLSEQLSRAEAWGPVELLDLGTGEHKLNLLDGLYFAEREPDGRTFAWSWGDETSFLLTCPSPRPCTLAICCRRLGVEQLDDLQVEVSLNGNSLGIFTPGTEYADHRLEAPAGAWLDGDNILVLHYSEDVYLPDVIPGNTDTRRVAVQMDAIRIIAGLNAGDDAKPVLAGEGRVGLPVPADVSWHFQVPLGGLLVFGSESGDPAELRVSVATDDAPPIEIYRRRIPAGGQSDQVTLDLAHWSGRFVRLTCSVDLADGAAADTGQTVHLLQPEIRAPAPPPAPPLPAAPAGPPPDVLVYVMDALRAGHLSAYGHPRRTSPVLDRLSRQGQLFSSAFSQAPNTAPSVKSLFTGRFLPFTGYAVLSPDHPTMAEVFSRSGYSTGLFSNNPYMGPELGFYRGFDHVAEEILFRRQPVKDFAGQATDAFINWAAELPAGRPFFAYVHTIHPHNPYQAPAPFDGAFQPAGEGPEEDLSTEALLEYVYGQRALGDGTLQRMRDHYDGDILYNDLELGRLLAWLGNAGRDRETVIFITADHGEELADHGGLLHGFTLYDEQIHVPLILVPPAGRAAAGAPGTVITHNVRLVDLAPTLFEMSGVTEPPPTEGDPLTGFTGHRTVFSSASSAAGIYTVRTGRWKYVFAPRTRHLWGMGEGLGRTRKLHYLFDLQADPGERQNLASRMQVTRKALQARLLEWIHRQSLLDNAAGDEERGRMPDFDEETRQRLLDLGYIAE